MPRQVGRRSNGESPGAHAINPHFGFTNERGEMEDFGYFAIQRASDSFPVDAGHQTPRRCFRGEIPFAPLSYRQDDANIRGIQRDVT